MADQDSTTAGPPYIPALESARVSAPHVPAACFFGLLYSVPTAVLLVRCWRWLGEALPVALAGTGALGVVSLWLLYKGITSAYRWETDADGIRQRSILRKTMIRWDDVRSVEHRRTWAGSYLRIVAGAGSAEVSSEVASGLGSELAASVWQHLQRRGKAEAICLPPGAASYWDTIPDEVSRQVEWTDTRFATRGAFRAGAEGITRTHGGRALTIPWSEVTRAGWARGTELVLLEVRAGRRHVRIRLDPKSDDSGRLVLCAIRYLREAGFLVWIPQALRAGSSALERTRPSAVEARIPATLGYALALTMGLMSLMIALMPQSPIQPVREKLIFGMIAFAGALLAAIAACRYSIIGDETGITRHTILGTRSVRWDDVSSYGRNTGLKGRYTRSITLDVRAAKPLRINGDWLMHSDWWMLAALIDRRLAHLAADPRPWLARPWSRRP